MKFNDLVSIGYQWKCNISWRWSSEETLPKEFVQNFVAAINKSLGWTKGSGKNRVCQGFHRQLLVKHGKTTSKYNSLISILEKDKTATEWILGFLKGKNDFNDNIDSKNAVYAKDFVCIVCMAEVARGYGNSTLKGLTDFIEGIVNGTNKWSELKEFYGAANSSREDEDYMEIEDSDEEDGAVELTDEDLEDIKETVKEAKKILGKRLQLNGKKEESSNSGYNLRPRK